MSAANQSTKPSVFLPIIRNAVASSLGLDNRFVRIVAQPDPKDWSYQTSTTAAAVYLQTQTDIPDAGAGRVGTPISQVVEVTVRTRGFGNQAGGNETLALTHYDSELKIQNALHLVHLTLAGVPLFIMPIRLVPGGEGVVRSSKLDGVLETVLQFRIDYVLAVGV